MKIVSSLGTTFFSLKKSWHFIGIYYVYDE